MGDDVFVLLDREWESLVATPRARRAFRLWPAKDPFFSCVTSLDDVVKMARSANPVEDRYAMTNALLVQAAHCPLAERALIQAQIPAMRALSRKARGWTGERLTVSYGLKTPLKAGTVASLVWSDLDAIAIAGAAEFIRRHAGEDVPYAGLKIRDHTRNRLRSFVWSDLRRTDAEQACARSAATTTESRQNPSAELLELLWLARDQNLLTLPDLRLIIGHRLLGITDREYAERTFVSPATANRLRSRVEKKLALAMAP